MQQPVMNHQLEWELSQCSVNLMGHHSSPMRKVSAKRFSCETQAGLLDQATRTWFVVLSIEKGPATKELDQVSGWPDNRNRLKIFLVHSISPGEDPASGSWRRLPSSWWSEFPGVMPSIRLVPCWFT